MNVFILLISMTTFLSCEKMWPDTWPVRQGGNRRGGVGSGAQAAAPLLGSALHPPPAWCPGTR